MRLRDTVYRGYYEINEGKLDSFVLIFVMENADAIDAAIKIVNRQKNIPSNVKIMFGAIEILEEDSQLIFKPFGDFTRQRGLFDDV